MIYFFKIEFDPGKYIFSDLILSTIAPMPTTIINFAPQELTVNGYIIGHLFISIDLCGVSLNMIARPISEPCMFRWRVDLKGSETFALECGRRLVHEIVRGDETPVAALFAELDSLSSTCKIESGYSADLNFNSITVTLNEKVQKA